MEKYCIFVIVLVSLVKLACGVTDPGDAKVLNDFRNGLENSERLQWPKGNDPCGPPAWKYVFCSNGRVTQIQAKNLGLEGTLPDNLNQLDKLENVGLQGNKFHGKLPSFSGLANLQYAYLDSNNFDSIPYDFFHGLSSIRVLALDHIPFNETSGWSIPAELGELSQLMNFSCSFCNIVGPIPDFFGKLPSLGALRLANNRLSGEIPWSFRDSMLQVLWLNDQDGGGLSGSIEVIGTMVGLTQVWLHGNQFSGPIPDNIGSLTSLKDLHLDRNQLVGIIPQALANMELRTLKLDNNMLMGPIPKFKSSNVSYAENSFCQAIPGELCAPEVDALLDFLHDVNYPPNLSSQWTGNDPCKGPWWGIVCSPNSKVSVINLQKQKLNGTLSPSLVKLDSLVDIHLGGNNLHGRIPANLTELKYLKLLDLTGNSIDPPIPKFPSSVKVLIDEKESINRTVASPVSPINDDHTPIADNRTSSGVRAPSSASPGSTSSGQQQQSGDPKSGGIQGSSTSSKQQNSGVTKTLQIVGSVAGAALAVGLGFLFIFLLVKKRKAKNKTHAGAVDYAKHSSGSSNMFRMSVLDDSTTDIYTSGSRHGAGSGRLESGNLVHSVEVLRRVTNNFAQENELGRGGFGAVYKGELDDGTQIAVKRMEAGVVSNKGLDEFRAEIAVLSKVRHRHLVSLMGFAVEGNERLLVYEYMPEGALSRHIFRWKSLNLMPLSWAKRLIIALDVARGMEYLHSLAHQSFIHRDLKSANILLSNDFRAKVADFGLVKLAPDSDRSVATRLAGTFGYLAPEYAVTGKITTKVDVFSFGVVLMELLTGLTALDEQRSDETRYLAEWFWQIKSDKEKLISAVDPVLDAKEDTYESIYTIAELAGHCTARDPSHRPEMGYAVNVLARLVEKWKPVDIPEEEFLYYDLTPLPDMLKGWQETETKDFSTTSLDSKGSIPAKPNGFADSFTSSDAR
ncbi:hypothetical protein Leryth_014763 [Lithospermum erythrorhizon]|uniref:Protein kinase domain-containing protein n=1 Tax=Lithospermum erythrorhizon TaxID=34254 RepID=A0AAV3PTK4_LITER|nr:hypothetical protein Leryth_014763 [Lithospermum erythrorhizon]